MTKKVKGLIAFSLLAVLLIAVFIFSSQNGDGSSSLSMKVAQVVAKLTFFRYDNMTSSQQFFISTELNFFVRKVAHFLIYMLIGMCSYYLMLLFGGNMRKKVLAAGSMCLAFAALDEIHQLFVPGRDFKITDIMLDLIGAFFGMLILKIIFIIIEYIKNILKNKRF